MQEAAFVNFLRTLLIIVLIYYAAKIVMRLVLPLVFKKFVKKAEERFKNQTNYTKRDQQTKVGETTIDKAPKQNSSNNSVGEYVDFEEID